MLSILISSKPESEALMLHINSAADLACSELPKIVVSVERGGRVGSQNFPNSVNTPCNHLECTWLHQTCDGSTSTCCTSSSNLRGAANSSSNSLKCICRRTQMNLSQSEFLTTAAKGVQFQLKAKAIKYQNTGYSLKENL